MIDHSPGPAATSRDKDSEHIVVFYIRKAMDITTLRDSKEALFADIMAATSNSDNMANTNCHPGLAGRREEEEHDVAVELRRSDKKSRRVGAHSPKKPRPSSMIALPTSSSASPSSGGRVSGSVAAALLGRGFNFSRPKAFFSSEQHLSERVEGYNSRKESAYKLKMTQAASQVKYENACVKWTKIVANVTPTFGDVWGWFYGWKTFCLLPSRVFCGR